MRCITEHKKWGVLQPRDTCTNTGEPVLDLLWSKHPEASAPLDISLEAYPRQTPELLPENLTEDTEIEVAWRLSGGAGQGGTNSVSLQHWLLQFDKTSGELRQLSHASSSSLYTIGTSQRSTGCRPSTSCFSERSFGLRCAVSQSTRNGEFCSQEIHAQIRGNLYLICFGPNTRRPALPWISASKPTPDKLQSCYLKTLQKTQRLRLRGAYQGAQGRGEPIRSACSTGYSNLTRRVVS